MDAALLISVAINFGLIFVIFYYGVKYRDLKQVIRVLQRKYDDLMDQYKRKVL